jgi:small acid-soluble spore protein H (minor)
LDYQRAEQILRSPETIQVFHNDQSVWIEGLDKQQNTAIVSIGATKDQKRTVPINELQEKH